MLRNTSESYGWVTIVVHWVMALCIFFIFALGLYMVDLTYYDSWYKGSLSLHKSLGLSLLFVLFLRFMWRSFNEKPKALPGKYWEQLAAHVMHLSLYALLLVLMISGYFISTADGRAISVFELFDLPALPWRIDNQEDIAGQIHEILAWIVMLSVALHALAAIKHHWLNKDDGLKRMFKPKS